MKKRLERLIEQGYVKLKNYTKSYDLYEKGKEKILYDNKTDEVILTIKRISYLDLIEDEKRTNR